MIEQLKEILEALIFISVDPLTMEKMREVLPDAAEDEIAAALKALGEELEARAGAVKLSQTAGGWVFSTKPAYDPWVRKLLQIERRKKISLASLESLSAIAYHQPVTHAEISLLRGVQDSTYALHTLLDNKLIKIAGRKEAPGRPLLYRTTDKFLAYFGLNSLEELPKEDELRKIMEEGNA